MNEETTTKVMSCSCGWIGHEKETINNKNNLNACPDCSGNPTSLTEDELGSMPKSKWNKIKNKIKKRIRK